MKRKIALILHGWPQFNISNHFLVKFLKGKGYRVITPNMFSNDNNFTSNNVLSKVKRELKGESLDLIVGISLGGLVAPHIAKEYPNAKLIFIASGTTLKSNSRFFNIFLKIVNTRFARNELSRIKNFPRSIHRKIYVLANPFKGNRGEKEIYNQDLETNLNYINQISVQKEIEILNFLQSTNNTEILKDLCNQSIIINGEKDLLMGKDNGKNINNLLKNSELIISEGSHFNSFTPKDLKHISAFAEIS